MRSASAPARADSSEHRQRHRHRRRPGLQRGVAERALEHETEEEEHDGQRAVQQERDDVRAAERRATGTPRAARAAIGVALLGEHERHRAGPTPTSDGRPRAPRSARTSRRPGRRAPSAAPSQSTLPVASGSRLSGTWRRATSDHGDPDRQVDQEDPPPRRGVDEPAAEERADRRGHATEPGPRPDRPRRGRAGRTRPGGWRGCPGVSRAAAGALRRRGPRSSSSTLGATAQANEASVKPAAPRTNMRRRP